MVGYPAPESPKLLLGDGGASPQAFGAGFRSAPKSQGCRQLLLAELHYVGVPGMTMRQLAAFVRRNMPRSSELLKLARRAGLPEVDGEGRLLIAYLKPYRAVPSRDLTIRFRRIAGAANCVQFASGGGESRRIKEALRQIVQRRIACVLRRQGIHCTVSRV